MLYYIPFTFKPLENCHFAKLIRLWWQHTSKPRIVLVLISLLKLHCFRDLLIRRSLPANLTFFSNARETELSPSSMWLVQESFLREEFSVKRSPQSFTRSQAAHCSVHKLPRVSILFAYYKRFIDFLNLNEKLNIVLKTQKYRHKYINKFHWRKLWFVATFSG